ncbi:RsmB/NOP family class I SAM-dependent RNA methyltransferase [Paenibacillus sp. YN15]|uniref:RsmB/NOP family class I SAM-dependent RNA methyltransferase n=1 Tax=Paenibacillus sp. YN15 TaxID=1742774 RepID=UPI000DCB571F|nr:RsmB/NOP family class I SAM-dependent RNA methyltransferase [Paenibacillus sp. YN15]RAU99887.1 rRNA cytosine-C5-methyltransferase [Paenibacillus sp. YN15]
MDNQLPEAFRKKMRRLLGEEEYGAYLASFGQERHYGLRSNPLKLTAEELGELSPFELTPVPWCPTGYYYGETARPGKHPYYHAGMYYIQEPSAMIPAELLDVQPGDRVLDLCAAPGGKTTQLAGKLQGQGFLAANDNSLDRVKALTKNVELAGIRNAMVTHETPDRLAERWPQAFNKILVDAPCSGEGMFRKDEDMIRQWEKHSVAVCMAMQEDILRDAARMLAAGGRLVYSTCTFSPEENESMIAGFLRQHPDFRVVPAPAAHGFVPGRPDWAAEARGAEAPDAAELETAGAVRLWPHRIKGEGHFAVILEKQSPKTPFHRKEGTDSAAEPVSLPAAASRQDQGRSGGGSRPALERAGSHPKARQTGQPGGGRGSALVRTAPPDLAPWEQFVKDNLTQPLAGTPVLFGERLYLAPTVSLPVAELKIYRPGWYAGELKRGRFEPSHALAMGLFRSDARRVLSLPAASPQIIHYLKGETLEVEESALDCADGTSPKGYVLVCVDRFPLGWGKWNQGMLKNEYPAGWRWV